MMQGDLGDFIRTVRQAAMEREGGTGFVTVAWLPSRRPGQSCRTVRVPMPDEKTWQVMSVAFHEAQRREYDEFLRDTYRSLAAGADERGGVGSVGPESGTSSSPDSSHESAHPSVVKLSRG